MSYVLPDKSLLSTDNEKIKSIKQYYNLSKLLYKKDLENKLVFPVGIDKDKEKYYMDLKSIPSVLVLGETGSGKSMLLHDIIISLLLKNTPSELGFIFIDPRKAELQPYSNLPHTISLETNVNDIDMYLKVLQNIVERRRTTLFMNGAKNIEDYNDNNKDAIMPHILIIMDEIEDSFGNSEFQEIMNILTMDCHKLGIHIIIASSTYLKKFIKEDFLNNFKYLLSFDLAQKEQADFIKLDGANLLTVTGEALIKCPKEGIIDLQVPYVSDKDIQNVVNFITSQNIKK